MAYRELMIGAGRNRVKQLVVNGRKEWSDLTALDMDAGHRPDIVWDLTNLPLPFEDERFDEIHAYQVLDLVGRQGDYKFFFAQFSDFWRILKPGGLLCGSTVAGDSRWLWGDPGHSRVIKYETLILLDQEQYAQQVGVSTMTDYRFLYRADFQLLNVESPQKDFFFFVLKAIKPSRVAPA